MEIGLRHVLGQLRFESAVETRPMAVSQQPDFSCSISYSALRYTSVAIALVRKYHTLGIASLNVAGMIRAGLQSKALSDAGISTLLDQIRYKARWYVTIVAEADRWYSSSKTCSACGGYNAELGRQLHWSCTSCGVNHDRNENAARNLRKLALLAVGEEVMLLDGGALAGDAVVAGETAPVEGRTKPRTGEHGQLSLVL